VQILWRCADQDARFLPNLVNYGEYLTNIPFSYFSFALFHTDYFQPQRCMIYIKRNYPQERYETTFLSLWEWMYHKNIDISKPEKLAELLKSHDYSDQEIKDILESAKTPEYKEALTANTQKALDQGAYGAPWFWVRNKEGKEEPFFGSDR
jgi:2-hydroxychromene-2-carboxylate isomerase